KTRLSNIEISHASARRCNGSVVPLSAQSASSTLAFGLPASCGSKFSTCSRFTKVWPAIMRLLIRPFLTSLEIACLEIPRIRAASDWEIHSVGSIFSSLKLVDNVNLFYYLHYPDTRLS